MDIKNILILSMVKGIGPAFIKKNCHRLINDSSCDQIVKESKPEELDNLVSYAKTADEIMSDCKDNDIKMVSIIDAEYPSQLKEIGDPPSVLFIKGNLSLLNHVIAIIGTRHSSELGNKIAERVGSYFADYFSICNGLVEGIDEHSIYVGSKVLSNVVGIISGGLCYNETCSSHHIQVINDVLEAGGLIISEYYPRQKEDMYSGSKASRIQAGLSHGLILVQSKIDGGSKYTLAKFAKLGRPIGVIHFPSSAEYQSESFGANRLIAEKGKDGLAQMIGLKKTSSINIGPLIVLSNKDDYNKLIQSMSIANNNVLF
ncbi:DNA-processing protein DprA [Segatella bryantii]|jgi:DNA processing protein|uniref:DNA-processing protein DprA n=1 Tax=Segatella bryantii TaxID=77095 RepID=UPI0028534E63|nr:DNA-processing protein DprA [Segatella bryantii]MDR4931695.1 DNA-processing protein DprA [Segatella bryantii]